MLLGSGLLPHLGIAGGGGLTGATWAIDGNGRAYNTPTLGSELITNGGMETGDPPTGWVAVYSGTLSSDSVIFLSGAQSAKMVMNGSGSFAGIQQTTTTIAGSWVLFSGFVRGSTLAAAGFIIHLAGDVYTIPFSNGQWVQFLAVKRLTGTSSTARVYVFPTNAANAGAEWNMDEVTVKPLTLATLLATTQGTANQTPLAKVYAITTSTQAGAIGWLDDPTNPQNFVIGIRDGSGNVNLTKCVAGVYTNLISISSAFVADAAIEIRRPSGNTFQLWYNGSQVGTNQTINDAAIADNAAPYYGLFSTYSGNTFSEFRLDGTLIPFGF